MFVFCFDVIKNYISSDKDTKEIADFMDYCLIISAKFIVFKTSGRKQRQKTINFAVLRTYRAIGSLSFSYCNREKHEHK